MDPLVLDYIQRKQQPLPGVAGDLRLDEPDAEVSPEAQAALAPAPVPAPRQGPPTSDDLTAMVQKLRANAPQPDFEGLAAAQAADKERERSMALGRAGASAAALMTGRAPDYTGLTPDQMNVRNWLMKQQEEDRVRHLGNEELRNTAMLAHWLRPGLTTSGRPGSSAYGDKIAADLAPAKDDLLQMVRDAGGATYDGMSHGEAVRSLAEARKSAAASEAAHERSSRQSAADAAKAARAAEASKRKGEDTLDKQLKGLKTDFDPTGPRAGEFGKNYARVQAANRVLALAEENGQPKNLSPQFMTELFSALGSLISQGGQPAESLIRELTPYTSGRKVADWEQWFTNAPQGANQTAFVKQAIESAKRERDVAQTGIEESRDQRAQAHQVLFKNNPAEAKKVLNPIGWDLDENGDVVMRPELRSARAEQRRRSDARVKPTEPPATVVAPPVNPQIEAARSAGYVHMRGPDGKESLINPAKVDAKKAAGWIEVK